MARPSCSATGSRLWLAIRRPRAIRLTPHWQLRAGEARPSPTHCDLRTPPPPFRSPTCALPATSSYRAPVTIAIAVSDDSGLVATGAVQVSDNGAVVGTAGLESNGTAKITAGFNLGLHAISCSYSGDTMLAPSVSGVS